MKVIILAAGYGTSLYPLTKDTAQALLPIRGVPIIEHLMEKIQLLDSIDEIFVVSNHRFLSQLNSWLADYAHKTPIKIVDNGSHSQKDSLGATRDLAFAINSQNIDSDILVVGVDNIFSFNLGDFVNQATAKKPDVSIAIHKSEVKVKSKRYGMVTLDDAMRVTNFTEKPSKINGARVISMCLYFIPQEKLYRIAEFLDQTSNGILIGNYIKWLSEQESIYALDCKGAWLDIADEDSYMQAICNF